MQSIEQTQTNMSRQEAQDCVSLIKLRGNDLRKLLFDLHNRRGWEALGYKSWRECVNTEFPQGQSYLYYLLRAARVERGLLDIPDIQPEISTLVESLPETHLRALSELDDPLDQRVALQLAASASQQTIVSEKPTASYIEAGVRTVQDINLTGGSVDIGDGKMTAAVAATIVHHNDIVNDKIEKAKNHRGVKSGEIDVIAKRAHCRIVGSSSRQVTFEFDDPAEAEKLRKLYLSGAARRMTMNLLQTKNTVIDKAKA